MAKRDHNNSLMRGTKWGPSEVLEIILFHDLGDDYSDVCFISIHCTVYLFSVLFLTRNSS